MTTQSSPARRDRAKPATRRGQAKLVVGGVLGALIVVVIAVSFLVGAVIGALALRHMNTRSARKVPRVGARGI